MLKWYMLKTIVGQETGVATQLVQGEVPRRFPRQIGDVIIPRDGHGNILFPGYVLVELGFTPNLEEAIRTLPGSIGFMTGPTKSKRFKGIEVFEGVADPDTTAICHTPEPVTRDEIDRIRRHCS